MKLSTRTRYGIRAILELALNHGKGPLQLKVIGRRQDISVKYLEQLIAVLKTAGFVSSSRGSKGGYVLAKAPNQIKLSDVFNSLEGASVITVECVENEGYCARAADCVVRQVWVQVQEAMMGVLAAITLEDLVKRTRSGKIVDYQI